MKLLVMSADSHHCPVLSPNNTPTVSVEFQGGVELRLKRHMGATGAKICTPRVYYVHVPVDLCLSLVGAEHIG